MIFLGTGAAEAIPNPFCQCPVCKNARESKDPKEKRARSAFSIDDKNFIDFGPDIINSTGRFGVSLSNIQNLFFTHFHTDHFCLTNLEDIRMSLTGAPNFNVFLSKPAYEGIQEMKKLILSYGRPEFDRDFKLYDEHMTFVPMEAYDVVKTGNMSIMALPTIHLGFFRGETAINYLFERDGKRFLYASDTGLYPDKTFEVIKGKELDVLVIEGSFGLQKLPENAKHLTIESLGWMFEKFKKAGVITDKTKIYITHIAHKGQLSHYQYVEKANEVFGPNVQIAYDGLEIEGF